MTTLHAACGFGLSFLSLYLAWRIYRHSPPLAPAGDNP